MSVSRRVTMARRESSRDLLQRYNALNFQEDDTSMVDSATNQQTDACPSSLWLDCVCACVCDLTLTGCEDEFVQERAVLRGVRGCEVRFPTSSQLGPRK